MILWSGIHLFLAKELLKVLPVVGEFFVIDAVLVIIGALVMFMGFRLLYIPVLVLNWANYLLLAESRIFPAPVLGFPLPAINSFVVGTFFLDIIIIAVNTVVFVTK
ncbi:hypothetical protein DFR87_03895 [Metallosphaera hakonensis JCM 8857 = DSM 7519]|uniref:Uncharacterized protein n=2 Tax=Metallosphaera hakonensis TaxID=79601 RepID=A0A2U9IXC2_9CREN|nr:hypothetical protein DFR87_03895 [Metallosphaera hakonensis JCM 8857 = DSM 7519]